MEWLYHWGMGHDCPQLIISGVIPVSAEEQKAILEYYQYLQQKLAQ